MGRDKRFWGAREESSLFPYKRTAFFSGAPNFFGPSYFEAALVPSYNEQFWSISSALSIFPTIYSKIFKF